LTSWIIEGQLSNALKLKMLAGHNESFGEERVLMKHTIYKPSLGRNSTASNHQFNTHKSLNWNVEPQLLFYKDFGSHKVDALIGLTFMNQSFSQEVWKGSNFASNSLIADLKAAKIIQMLSNIQNEYAYQ